jgi:hypothetical protein
MVKAPEAEIVHLVVTASNVTLSEMVGAAVDTIADARVVVV